MIHDMNDAINYAFDVANEDPIPLMGQFACLTAEVGELAEQVNSAAGYLSHKKFDEPLAGEVADVILAAIGVYTKAYPEATKEELAKSLRANILTKSTKWHQIALSQRRKRDKGIPGS
jgi:hypothetical protein